MKKILAFGFGFLSIWAGLAFARESSTFHVIGPREPLGIGAEFELKIVVDTEDPVNAYQVAMTFNPEIVEVVSTNDTASIIDIMRDQPKVYAGGKVTFSGASLKPFAGGDGLLLAINMRILKEGASDFDFEDSFVYLANGKGTKVKVESGRGSVESREGIAVQKEATIVDDAPPSVLNLSITDDPINPKQKLLGFLVRDNSTGIQQTYYQYRKWLFWSNLEVAQNPMALPKTAWAVKFRAIDNTGNISEKIVYDWKAFVYYNLITFVFGALALMVVINRIRKSFQRKRV